MMSQKVKEMFEELQNDYRNLEKEKLKKESELMENIRVQKESAKKKIKESNHKIS